MYIQDIYIRDRYMKILATFSWLQIKVGLLLFRMKLFSFQCIFQLWVYIILHNCAKTVADVRYILKHEDEEEIRRIKLQVVQPIPYRDRQYISKDCMILSAPETSFAKHVRRSQHFLDLLTNQQKRNRRCYTHWNVTNTLYWMQKIQLIGICFIF